MGTRLFFISASDRCRALCERFFDGTADEGVALFCLGGSGVAEMSHKENDRIVESTTEARAGVTGQNVRYVLLIGTLLAIVFFAIAYVTRT